MTEALAIPTIGIGAGHDCDAQVLVWQDMAGLRGGRAPRSSSSTPTCAPARRAARAYADDVAAGTFPAAEHTFES